MEFISGQVQDLEPGLVSLDDVRAMWDAYAGANRPHGISF